MLAIKRQEWIDSLRSDKWKQGRFRLRQGDNFCCLGVLCDLEDNTKWSEEGLWCQASYIFLPLALKEKYNITCSATLMEMNDAGHTFAQIADWIEKNVPIDVAPELSRWENDGGSCT